MAPGSPLTGLLACSSGSPLPSTFLLGGLLIVPVACDLEHSITALPGSQADPPLKAGGMRGSGGCGEGWHGCLQGRSGTVCRVKVKPAMPTGMTSEDSGTQRNI